MQRPVGRQLYFWLGAMDYFSFVFGFLIAAGGGIAYTIFAPGGAKNRAKAILDSAEEQAANRISGAELAAKQLELEKQRELETELKRSRESAHERERKVDKAQSLLEQRDSELSRRDSILTASQNRAQIKLEQLAQTEKDLLEILDKQRKQLHEVTGLSQEEATKRLLKLLEDELADEVGARILKHEKALQETCERTARNVLTLTMQRLASEHTANLTTNTCLLYTSDAADE